MSGALWMNGRIVAENVSIEISTGPFPADLHPITTTVGPEGLPGKFSVTTVLSAEDADRLFGVGSELASAARRFYAQMEEAERQREAQAANRRAWRERILARLDNPTEDDRAEAAEMAAWLRRTLGEVLPLPP